jgi:hypothetical protein
MASRRTLPRPWAKLRELSKHPHSEMELWLPTAGDVSLSDTGNASMRTVRPVYTGPWRKGALAGPGDDRRRIDAAVAHAITGITGKAMLHRPTDLTSFRAANGGIGERRDIADGGGPKSVLKRLHDLPCKPITPMLRTPDHTARRYHTVCCLVDSIAVADDVWQCDMVESDGASLNHAFLPRLKAQLSSEDFR